MGYRLGVFAGEGLNEGVLREAIEEHVKRTVPRLSRLWAYFRNPDEGRGGKRRLAQEAGLPSRLTGGMSAWEDDRAALRREVVIENDIGWRIQAMVDFVAGRGPAIRSEAGGETGAQIERVMGAVFEASGGAGMLQEAALLAHVYGHVDFLVRREGSASGEDAGVRIGIVEPTRAFPILDPDDYRRMLAYVVHFPRRVPGPGGFRTSWYTEILTGGARQVYEDEALVDEHVGATGARGWNAPPVVHVQNIAQPFRYEGIGEVEGLIPLQDELNTRLSDRASRVTLQSFKMYLAKGIEGFDRVPVAPGQVWRTDNPDAEIVGFGGDASSPSEDAHIEQVREAMDKTSGVPPLAGGVVRAKIGNLSSANALRVTLLSVLSRTARKRAAYARAIGTLGEMVLGMLDDSGVLATEPRARRVRVVWPDPLPEDLHARVENVRTKASLGAERGELLEELGHVGGTGSIE